MSDFLLGELYRRHARGLRGFLSLRLRCDDTAADLAQEAFIRLLGVDGAAVRNPAALVYGIARNLAVDHHRAEGRCANDEAPPDFDELPSDQPDPEAVASARQQLRVIEAAVARLPPQCRRAFVLNRFEGLSQAEVAERMGISRQVVERHIAKALMVLRERLDSPD